MARFCSNCGRPKGLPYHYRGICDTVRLTDNRVVHRERIEIGGDIHDELGPTLKVEFRNITPEMRTEMQKSESD